MLKQLDRLADRSCWISGDRINACIAVDAHGIAEIGYHGVQPVSRNSRMLVRDQGVLSLGIIGSDGREEAVPLASVDWHPHKVSVEMASWEPSPGQWDAIIEESQTACETAEVGTEKEGEP